MDTAAYKEKLAAKGLLPLPICSKLASEAHRMRNATETEAPAKADVRCPQCHIVLSPERGNCRVLLEKKKKRRGEFLVECLGCAASMRCGLLPRVPGLREEFASESFVAESKKATPTSKATSTPTNAGSPGLKKIGSSMKKRSGVRRLERMVAHEKSSVLETPKTSLSAFLSSLQ